MSVSRGFLVVGPVYLAIGLLFGMHMGASGDSTMQPVHVHLNLLGFALMMIFGLAYRLLPEAGAAGLARLHFWLHQAGVLILMLFLTLLQLGRIGEDTPLIPLVVAAELAVVAGVLCFGWLMIRHAS